jgi:DNA-binding transcriptional ArsR family regulator
MKLNPTLWRTCRVLAGEPRLQLLWHIFDAKELSVQQLSECTGMSRQNTSTQLRAMSARGLISLRREKMNVFYRAEPNTALNEAPQLLEALKACYARSTSFKTLIRMATGFTHERRIEIVHALNEHPLDFQKLLYETGMSSSALSRHLDKLIVRGYVKYINRLYRRTQPGNPLGRTLLKIIRNRDTK